MLRYTPVSDTSAAALIRIQNNLSKGYTRYISGSFCATKLHSVARKLHQRHNIGASPSQRHTRKKKGIANALLTIYLPPSASSAEFLLQFTPGALQSPEKLLEATKKPHLQFLEYEFVRREFEGKIGWTARRSKARQQQLYSELEHLYRKKYFGSIKTFLEKAAAEPGFRGIRQQNYELQREAVKRGFKEENLPFLYYIQKIPHGDLIQVS